MIVILFCFMIWCSFYCLVIVQIMFVIYIYLIVFFGYVVDFVVMICGVVWLCVVGYVVENEVVLDCVELCFVGSDVECVVDINVLVDVEVFLDIVLVICGGYGVV